MIVSVSGATSRAGKTALATSVLGALPAGAAAAVKFTTTEDVFERCPRGSPCVVCDIDVPFRIVDDPRVLDEPGTDTKRLQEAGASRVIWAIARSSHVAAAWSAVKERIREVETVVMEGSTIVDTAQPDVLFFVVHPFLSPSRWKATSAALIERADAVIVNRAASEGRDPAPAVLDAIRIGGEGAPRVADVTRPFADWAPDLCARIRDAAVPARPAAARALDREPVQ